MPNRLRQTEIAHTLRTVIAAGLAVERIEIGRGVIMVQTAKDGIARQNGQQSKLLTTKQACLYIPCSRSRLYKMIGKRQIIAVKQGRTTMISRLSVDRYLASLKRLKSAIIR